MNSLLLILTALALATTQALAGGRHVALCLPGLALLAVAAVLSWWPMRHRAIPKESGECLAAAIVFAGYVAVRALLSPEPYLARTDLYVALGALALYLLVALNFTTSRLRLWFVVALLALAVADCGIGALQTFKGQNFMPFSFLSRPDYGTRASGFYGYPSHLAGFLEMTLMLALGVVCWSRWPTWAKILLGYICAVILLGIVATGSRGGYISTAIGLLTFVLLSFVLIGKLGAGRAIVILIVGGGLLAGAAYGVHRVLAKSFLLESRAETTLTVDTVRIRLWQAGWKQFQLHPVAGTGSGTYLYYGRQFRRPGVATDPVHAHNDYVELLGEYGILGMIMAAVFLETHLRQGWTFFAARVVRGAGGQSPASNSLALNIGALSATACCFTHSLLDFNLHMPANILMAAFVFSLLSSPSESAGFTAGAESEEGWPAPLRFVLPALGILMAVKISPTAPAEYYNERVTAILADWHRSVSPEPNREIESLATRGLAWDPRNPDLYYALGEAQSALGDLETDPKAKQAFYEQAIESHRKALEFASGDVNVVLALGTALDDIQQFAESDPLFARAVTLDPRGSWTHDAFGNHLLLEGKFAEAETEFHLAEQFGARHAVEAGHAAIEDERKAKGESASPAPGSNPGK